MIVAVAFAGPASPAGAQDAPSVSVAPDKVVLRASGPSRVAVTVTNPSARVVRASVDVEGLVAEEADPVDLPPSTSDVVMLRLEAPADAPAPGTALVVVTTTPLGAGAPAPSRTAVALAVEPAAAPPAPKIDEIATVSVDTAATTIDDIGDEALYLLVRNVSAVTVKVTDVRTTADGFDVDPADGADVRKTISPGRTAAIPYRVSAGAQPPGGPRLVVFNVKLAWNTGGDTFHANTTVSHKVEVGAYGESDLGEILEIPTLLLLPGVFLLGALTLLWQVFGLRLGRSPGDSFPLAPKTAGFWLAALALSAVAVVLYGRATDGRNLLLGYTSRDIAALTVATIVAGVVAYLLVRWVKRELAERTTATPDDATPVAVLEKLGKAGGDVWLERATATLAGASRPVFLVNQDYARKRWLVAPEVGIRFAGPVQPGDPELERRLADLLVHGADAGDLADLLAAHASRVEAKWRPGAGPERPMWADADKVVPSGERRPLVRL